ncbi:MAG: YceD family protein [Thiohalospira sp.]
MSAKLPGPTDPVHLARSGQALSGTLRVAELSRLAESVREPSGEVAYELRFGEEEGVPTLRGRIAAEVTVTCQRCLGPLKVRVEAEPQLGFVDSEAEEAKLPEGLEGVVLEEGENIRPGDLIEDEVLLALPLFPAHDTRTCPPWEDPVELSPAEEQENPFAVLAGLRGGQDGEH